MPPWTLDSKVLLRLRRPWYDRTRAICFEPTEFSEKIAAMIPKPRLNPLVHHGIFAPHARWREDAVRRAREAAEVGATEQSGGDEAGPAASEGTG